MLVWPVVRCAGHIYRRLGVMMGALLDKLDMIIWRVLERLWAVMEKLGGVARKVVERVGVRRLVLSFVVTCVLAYTILPRRYEQNIKCECERLEYTTDRVARYLHQLMAERDPISNRTTQESIKTFHPSLAVDFLVEQERRGHRCHSTPGLFSIRHNNDVWQEAVVGGVSFMAYGAYYDSRDDGGPVVRVLVMVPSVNPPTPTCHLWYGGDLTPTPSTALRIEYVHWQTPLEDNWLPYIVTCRAQAVPRVVSLVPAPCHPATTALRVLHHDVSRKKGLALCHKFIFNSARDFAPRLVEWVEAARAWGVDHITTYEASSHPNVRRVLDHYVAEGFVTVLPWRSPGHLPNIPNMYRMLYDTQRYTLFTTENVAYTDCLLRHMDTHRYVAVWDVDEFILPSSRHASLVAMVDTAKAAALASSPSPPTSYLAQCSYFFDNLTEAQQPRHLHMLSHVTRTRRFSQPRVFTKAVHDTQVALGLHAHFALVNIRGEVDRDKDLYPLDPETDGFLGHYRAKCQGESQQECDALWWPDLTRDETMWRHLQAIATRTNAVLTSLGLLKNL